MRLHRLNADVEPSKAARLLVIKPGDVARGTFLPEHLDYIVRPSRQRKRAITRAIAFNQITSQFPHLPRRVRRSVARGARLA